MRITKAFFTTAILLAVTVPSYAGVNQLEKHSRDYEIVYPSVLVENNQVVQNAINDDIQTLVDDFMDGYNAGSFIKGNLKYKVKYEDADYISIVFYDYRYSGGNHGAVPTGIVWDKRTGGKLSISYFIKLKKYSDLVAFPEYWKAYNAKGEHISSSLVIENLSFSNRAPDDYFLAQNGCIGLIGYWGSTADGPCSIIVSQRLVDFFNRRNS